jgi:hypothetical protein
MVTTDHNNPRDVRKPFLRIQPHIIPFLLGAFLFFGLNLLPALIQGQTDSLGNNTDSIWHYLKILRLRGELAPHASFDMDVRLPTDERLYTLISGITDASGLSLIRVLQILWFAYSLFFVLGSYLLGYRLAGNRWGGAFLAASGWGFGLAIGGHWGWDYSPIVPHDLATAFVPWLVLFWLRLRSALASAGYFALLGIMAQIYPTTFVHLAGLTLVAHLLLNPKDIRTLATGAAVFLVAVLPLALKWGSKGPIPPDLIPLVQERLPYLAPGGPLRIIAEFKIFFPQLLLGGIAALLLRDSETPNGWSRIRALGWAALLAGVLGQITARSPLLASLFVSRASRFSYIWLLLLQARAMVRPPRSGARWLGIVVCLVSLMLRPNLVGPLLGVLSGQNPRVAIDTYHPQDTPEFRGLCAWIQENTDTSAGIFTPPDGLYLFLRAYARRPVAILDKDLGCVAHARTPLLYRVWRDVLRAKKAYRDNNLQGVLSLASEWKCSVVVFPPEWRPDGIDIAFSNQAGSVMLLMPGTGLPEYEQDTGHGTIRQTNG